MDAPLAPKLCAGVLGRALLQGVLPPDAIPELCKPIEGGEVRRALVAPALQYVKVRKLKRTVFSGCSGRCYWRSACLQFKTLSGGFMPVCCRITVCLSPSPKACGPARVTCELFETQVAACCLIRTRAARTSSGSWWPA